MTLLAEVVGDFTQARGKEVMESLLNQYDDIDIVYCENDNEAFGAIDAIEAAGRTPEKFSYVDESMYAHDDTVQSVSVNGEEYPVTVVTREIMDSRPY